MKPPDPEPRPDPRELDEERGYAVADGDDEKRAYFVGQRLRHHSVGTWEVVEHVGGPNDDWRVQCLDPDDAAGLTSERVGRVVTCHREYMDRSFSPSVADGGGGERWLFCPRCVAHADACDISDHPDDWIEVARGAEVDVAMRQFRFEYDRREKAEAALTEARSEATTLRSRVESLTRELEARDQEMLRSGQSGVEWPRYTQTLERAEAAEKRAEEFAARAVAAAEDAINQNQARSSAEAEVERLREALERIEGEGPGLKWDHRPMRDGLAGIYKIAHAALGENP